MSNFNSFRLATKIMDALMKLQAGSKVVIRPSYRGRKFRITIERMKDKG